MHSRRWRTQTFLIARMAIGLVIAISPALAHECESGVNSDSRIAGEPDASLPWARDREMKAAHYFSDQMDDGEPKYDVSIGAAACLAIRMSRSEIHPDVVAVNRKTLRYGIAEGKGAHIQKAFWQFRKAIFRVGGLKNVDSLLVVVPHYARRLVRVDRDGLLVSRDGNNLTGFTDIPGRRGNPRLESLPIPMAIQRGMTPIHVIVLDENAEEMQYLRDQKKSREW